MPNRGPRKILDVNAPKRAARAKPGPKPKPKPKADLPLANPAEYVPPPRKYPKTRWSDEQIIEVLQFLYYHRILEKKPDGTIGEKLARYRSGTILQKSPELFQAPEGYRYRSPTYDEAADWFQIPKSTVSTWWKTKLEMIGVRPEPVPQAPMPDFLLQPRPAAVVQPPQTLAGIPGVEVGNGQPAPNSYNGVAAPQGPPGSAQVTTNGPQGGLNPTQAPDTMQGVMGTAQGTVPAAGPQVPAPFHGQAGVISQSLTADGSATVQNQPAPDSGSQEAAVVTKRESGSTDDDTPTPTPSEQLADVANFNEEVSNLDGEMSSSEEDEDEEEYGDEEQYKEEVL